MDQTPEQPIPIKKGVGLKLQTIIDNRFNVEGAAAKKPIPFSEIERRGKTDAVRDLNIHFWKTGVQLQMKK